MMKEITDEYIHKKQQQLEKKLKGILDKLFSSTTPQDYDFEMSSRSISYNKDYRIDFKTRKDPKNGTFTLLYCDIIKNHTLIENPVLHLKSSKRNFKFASGILFSLLEDMQIHTEILLDNKFNKVGQHIHITIYHTTYRSGELMPTLFHIEEREDKIIVGVDNFILRMERINKKIEKDFEKEFEITDNNQLTNFIIFLNLLSLCDTPDHQRNIVELLGYKEDECDTSRNLFGKTLDIFLQRDTEALSKTYQLIQMLYC